MMMRLSEVMRRLGERYGEVGMPSVRGPFEWVMWENACYLLPDARRLEVFEGLRAKVGLSAEKIAVAPDEVLMGLATRGGMRPETRVFRWREIARITLTEFGGDLGGILLGSYAAAKRALKKFPNIGEPGAEKILLFCGLGVGLPLESNGLRVLVRLGRGREQKDYGAMYRSVRDDLELELPKGVERLQEAYLLLREHGRVLCKEKAPLCAECPVVRGCGYAARRVEEFLR